MSPMRQKWLKKPWKTIEQQFVLRGGNPATWAVAGFLLSTAYFAGTWLDVPSWLPSWLRIVFVASGVIVAPCGVYEAALYVAQRGVRRRKGWKALPQEARAATHQQMRQEIWRGTSPTVLAVVGATALSLVAAGNLRGVFYVNILVVGILLGVSTFRMGIKKQDLLPATASTGRVCGGAVLLTVAALGILVNVIVSLQAELGISGGPVMGFLNMLQTWQWRSLHINAEQILRGLLSGCYPVWVAYIIGLVLARKKGLPTGMSQRLALSVALRRGSELLGLYVVGVVGGMILGDWYSSLSTSLPVAIRNQLAASVVARYFAYICVGLGLIRLRAKQSSRER